MSSTPKNQEEVIKYLEDLLRKSGPVGMFARDLRAAAIRDKVLGDDQGDTNVLFAGALRILKSRKQAIRHDDLTKRYPTWHHIDYPPKKTADVQKLGDVIEVPREDVLYGMGERICERLLAKGEFFRFLQFQAELEVEGYPRMFLRRAAMRAMAHLMRKKFVAKDEESKTYSRHPSGNRPVVAPESAPKPVPTKPRLDLGASGSTVVPDKAEEWRAPRNSQAVGHPYPEEVGWGHLVTDERTVPTQSSDILRQTGVSEVLVETLHGLVIYPVGGDGVVTIYIECMPNVIPARCLRVTGTDPVSISVKTVSGRILKIGDEKNVLIY